MVISENHGQSLGSNIVSNRFVNDQRDMGIIDPNSQTYLDWYRGINHKIEGGIIGKNTKKSHDLDIKNKPTISANS